MFSVRMRVVGVFLGSWLLGQMGLANLAAQSQAAADSKFSQELHALAEQLMNWELAPGASIVVVQGDEVIFNQSFGFADRELKRRATSDTVFYIASSTKSFVGLAAALAAERQQLNLDEPLNQLLSNVEFHRDIDPSRITLRELLSHSHGISNDGPLTFRAAFSGSNDKEFLKSLIPYHGPAQHGKLFEYGNIGFSIASLAIEESVGQSWKDWLQAELFEPLSMKSTTGFLSKVDLMKLAIPYRASETGFDRIHYAKSDANLHAAGGLLSTGNDMARWLLVNVNGGRIGGKQLFPQAVVETVQRPIAEQDNQFMSFQRTGYGLGWNTGIHEGQRMIHHFGAFQGFHCHVSLMPETRIGVAILVNSDSGILFSDTIASFVYARMLNAPDIQDRFGPAALSAIKSLADETRQEIANELKVRKARSQQLRHALMAYAGTYENQLLGRAQIWQAQDHLEIRMGPLWSAVEVFNAELDQLRVELTGSGQVLSFQFDGAGRAQSFVVDGYAFNRMD